MPHDMNASAIPYPSGAGDLPHHVLGADADRRLFGWLSQLERQRGYSFVSIGQSGEAALAEFVVVDGQVVFGFKSIATVRIHERLTVEAGRWFEGVVAELRQLSRRAAVDHEGGSGADAVLDRSDRQQALLARLLIASAAVLEADEVKLIKLPSLGRTSEEILARPRFTPHALYVAAVQEVIELAVDPAMSLFEAMRPHALAGWVCVRWPNSAWRSLIHVEEGVPRSMADLTTMREAVDAHLAAQGRPGVPGGGQMEVTLWNDGEGVWAVVTSRAVVVTLRVASTRMGLFTATLQRVEAAVGRELAEIFVLN